MLAIKGKNIFSILVGTALEYYDNMLFMHFLFILSPLFFPASNPVTSSLLAMGAFAAGYIIRPIGGIVFGHFGDRFGRKQSLYFSMIFMSFPTFIIGILPTYNQIGIAAPILLIFCRFAQNFFIGGESAGALVSLVEFSKIGSKGVIASLLNVGAMMGALTGTALGCLFMQPFMPEWGWRIPFLVGAIFAWIVLRTRLKISETPAFEKAKHAGHLLKRPLLNLLINQRIELLRTMAMSAGFVAPYYIVFVYMSNIFKNSLNLESYKIMAINSFIMLFCLLLFPLMGYLSDKFDRVKMIRLASLSIVIFSYPLFLFMNEQLSLFNVVCLQSILCIASAGVVGASGPLIASFYSTPQRYTGIAFGWSIGVAIFGASAPLVSTHLVIWTGDQSAPALFLVFCGIICALSTKNLKNQDPEPYEILPELNKKGLVT